MNWYDRNLKKNKNFSRSQLEEAVRKIVETAYIVRP
jgi:hypothetical protein